MNQGLIETLKNLPPNDMSRYATTKKLLENQNLPVPSVDTFFANPVIYNELFKHQPGSPEYNAIAERLSQAAPDSLKAVKGIVDADRGLRGAQKIGVMSGLGDSVETAQLIQDNPAVQTQAVGKVAASELEQEKTKALAQKRQEVERIKANVNTQFNALIPAAGSLKLFLERTGPVMDAIAGLDAEYEKKAGEIGPTKAGQLREAKRRMNPDIAKFDDTRKGKLPELEAQVKQVEEQRMQLETRMNLLASGAAAPKEGESLETIQAQVEASSYVLAAQRASLALAKNPTPENFAAMQSAKEDLDLHLESLTHAKNTAQESLDIRQGNLDEKIREFDEGLKYKRTLSAAQRYYNKTKDLDGTMAKFPGILGHDIRKVEEDPNKPLTTVSMSTEKNYGEAFSKQVAAADSSMRDAAIAAPDLIERAQRVQQVLATTETITGTGAEFRLQAAKALKLAGLADSDAIENTEALSADLASTTLDAIKASGLGSGSGFSNADREFLEKAKGGKITLEKGSLLRLAQLAERASQKAIEKWNKRVKEIPDSALAGTGISKEPMAIPAPKGWKIERVK
jgi:hypothetical protein